MGSFHTKPLNYINIDIAKWQSPKKMAQLMEEFEKFSYTRPPPSTEEKNSSIFSVKIEGICF